MKSDKKKISRISALHFFKLYFRSLLFIIALVVYVINRVEGNSDKPFGNIGDEPFVVSIIGVVYIVEMLLRFFPSSLESMGCQKQFAKNFVSTDVKELNESTWRSTLAVLVAWILLNGVIGVLYFTGVFDMGILALICLVYSVCDMICILFFCPFQTWFMKNKCCGSCRIYNWDYAMMFTPLVFIPAWHTYTMLGIALLLAAYWEVMFHLHPERFFECTNSALSCANCRERLCQHKKQLRHFLRVNKNRLVLKGNAVIEKVIKKKK